MNESAYIATAFDSNVRLDVKFGEYFQKLKDGDADLNIFRQVDSAINKYSILKLLVVRNFFEILLELNSSSNGLQQDTNYRLFGSIHEAHPRVLNAKDSQFLQINDKGKGCEQNLTVIHLCRNFHRLLRRKILCHLIRHKIICKMIIEWYVFLEIFDFAQTADLR